MEINNREQKGSVSGVQSTQDRKPPFRQRYSTSAGMSWGDGSLHVEQYTLDTAAVVLCVACSNHDEAEKFLVDMGHTMTNH